MTIAKHRKRTWLVNFVNRNNNKGFRNNPTHFVFFDTETKQNRIEGKKIGEKTYNIINNKLEMGWACYWNSETKEEDWFYFETNHDFHKWLSKICTRTGTKQLWLVAHNIVFDAIITDIWSFFKKHNYETDFIHSKGMTFIQKVKNNRKKSIMMVNNGNIFPAKLETIGKVVGVEKLEVDFQNDSKEFIKHYCRIDVLILVEFWSMWIKYINDNNLGNVKYTISSQSMEAYRKRFCNHMILLHEDLNVIEFERQGYFGGRTEIFFKGKVTTPVFYYDVNSLYPSVMINNRFPREYKFTKENPTISQMKYYIKKGWLVVAECTIKTTNRMYPLKSGSLLFPIGTFTTTLCTPELVTALENNDILSFGKVQFYTGDYIFKDFVEFFYQQRLEYKTEGSSLEALTKLFLNTLYGKFGQMFDKWVECDESDLKMLDPLFSLTEWILGEYELPKIIMEGLNLTPRIRYIGGQLQRSDEEEESQISFPAIAGHVTSYARLITTKMIQYCDENDIKKYYCDTDSICTNKPIPDRFISQSELGKWKLEKIFEHGVEFINLKNYCPLDENGNKYVLNEEGKKIVLNEESLKKESKIIKGKDWKLKGISDNAQIIDETHFITQEWGGLPKQEYYKKFGKKDYEFWIIQKEKRNEGGINKGILMTDGSVNPFVFGKEVTR